MGNGNGMRNIPTIKMSKKNLQTKFREWYKGREKIVKIQQGDDNLIAVIFYNKDMRYYEVGIYEHLKKYFRMLEFEERIKNRQEALSKFNKIVREF